MIEGPANPAQSSACLVHSAAGRPELQNVQLSISLGEVCPNARMRQAWQRIAGRHPELHDTFFKAPDGEFYRRRHTAGQPSWNALDWTSCPMEELPARWGALMEEEFKKPFDLSEAPLLRFLTINLPDGHCHLLAAFPKVLLDEHALFRILADWLDALEGIDRPEAPAPEASPRASGAANWWSRLLAAAPAPQVLRVLPAKAPTAVHSLREEVVVPLDRNLSTRFGDLCRHLGVSRRSGFLGLWALVLCRLTARDKACFLAPVESPLEEPSGLSQNLLPCLIAVPNSTPVGEWLKRVAQSEQERSNNGTISLGRAMSLAHRPRPLDDFSTAFAWLPPVLNERLHAALPRWLKLDARIRQSSQFPITFQVQDGESYTLRLEFDPSKFPRGEAEKLVERVHLVIQQVAESPATRTGDLTILTESELRTLAPEVTGDPIEEQALDLGAEMAALAKDQPLAIAVEASDGASLTYSELEACATLLAGFLAAQHPSGTSRIGLCLTPTPWVPLGLLGVAQSGNTCVPLDPGADPAWLAAKIEECDLETILCDSQSADRFEGISRKVMILDRQWEEVMARGDGMAPASPARVAFLITGTEADFPPSLPVITQELLGAGCRQSVQLWQLKPGHRIPLLAAPGTAAFIEVIVSALLAGATIVLPEDGEISASLLSTKATHARLAADQWRAWIASMRRTDTAVPDSLRNICVETGRIAPSIYSAWQTLNDARVGAAFFMSPAGLSGLGIRFLPADKPGVVAALSDLPIGFPGPGTIGRLLDPAGRALPPHYPGQIEIVLPGGSTDKAVISAWRDEAGFFHRVPSDNETVERALCEFSEVIDAHSVILRAEPKPLRFAWLLLADGATSVKNELSEKITARLDAEHRPDVLLAVSAFPLTPAGSIDVARLPRSEEAPQKAPSRAPEPARTDSWTPTVLLNKTPGTPLLFLVHDIEGDTLCCKALAEHLKGNWSVYGTTARGLAQPAQCHESLTAEAAALIKGLTSIDATGPYHLFGYGFGAVLAFEIARQLRAADRPVRCLILAGAKAPALEGKNDDWVRSLSKVFVRTGRRDAGTLPHPVVLSHERALREYRTQPLSGPCVIILGKEAGRDIETGWAAAAPGASFIRMTCSTEQVLAPPFVARLAVLVNESTAEAFGGNHNRKLEPIAR